MKVVGLFPINLESDLKIDMISEQPLGIAYVMAAAQKAGHDVKLFYEIPKLEELANSDVLALSLLTKDIPLGLEVVRQVKKINPGIKVIVGGHHISGKPDLVLEDCIDYGVMGEGEETFVELLNNLDNPEKIKGIVYKKDGQIIQTERRARINNLDGLRPIRDASFYPGRDHSIGYPAPSEKMLKPIISSRGCTFGCEFCTSPLIWQKKVIYRSPEDVIQEMEEISQDRERDFYFIDDENLFNRPEKAKELFKKLVGKDYNLGSCGDIRTMDEEMANLMQKTGWTQVWWGIESVHPQVLAREKKGSNTGKIQNVLSMFAEKGIANVGMVMVGFDYETEQDILRYAEEFPQYQIHQLRLGIATPFPGTAFEKRLKQQGVKFDPDLSLYDTGHLIYEHPTITPERMQELQQHIVQSFYRSQEWDKRMHDMAKNFPRMRQSIDEFRSYISSHL